MLRSIEFKDTRFNEGKNTLVFGPVVTNIICNTEEMAFYLIDEIINSVKGEIVSNIVDCDEGDGEAIKAPFFNDWGKTIILNKQHIYIYAFPDSCARARTIDELWFYDYENGKESIKRVTEYEGSQELWDTDVQEVAKAIKEGKFGFIENRDCVRYRKNHNIVLENS